MGLLRRRIGRRRALEAPDVSSSSLVTLLDPSGAAAEDYRTLRTSLLYTLVDTPPKAVVVTSPGPSEGKSTTCANLGVVLAQAGKSTLVMDCDLRRPTMHRVFGLRNMRGMVNILAGECELREVAQEEPTELLTVVTAGAVSPSPTELLGSRHFAEFLQQVRGQFDYVLMDAPPTELVSDPAILARQADGALLVFDAQNTRKGAARQAVRTLQSVGARVLGTVMNNARASRGGYYYGNRAYEQDL